MSNAALIVGDYRYRLERDAADPTYARGTVAFVMLNPSTADATQDDPTIRSCIGFARRDGYLRLVVVNLFALRATDPREIGRHEEPVGVANDSEIVLAVKEADRVIAAWGAPMSRMVFGRAARVENLIARHADLYALGTTKGGHPRHPLYLSNAATPALYRARAEGAKADEAGRGE